MNNMIPENRIKIFGLGLTVLNTVKNAEQIKIENSLHLNEHSLIDDIMFCK